MVTSAGKAELVIMTLRALKGFKLRPGCRASRSPESL